MALLVSRMRGMAGGTCRQVLPSLQIGSTANEMTGSNVIRRPHSRKKNQCVMNRQPSTSISGKHRSENFGEALGSTCQELRDRISALELKLAGLTGAIDILRGTTPPPERDTRALGELLSTERREFGDLLERRTREFELKLAELTGAVDILRGAQPPPPAQFPSVKAFSADTIYHEGDIVAFA